jgi:DtxR family Mn-dependent transcriptional regulator
MELTKSNEDYLEAIGLLVRERGIAQVRDIATVMNVKMPSVTSAVRQLAELGLVEYVQYAPVRLTKKGAKLADRIIQCHRTLHAFFRDILQLPDSRADEIACQVEHVMTQEEIERIAELTACVTAHAPLLKGFIDVGQLSDNEDQVVTLDRVRTGQRCIIKSVDPQMKGIARMADLGLVPGGNLRNRFGSDGGSHQHSPPRLMYCVSQG